MRAFTSLLTSVSNYINVDDTGARHQAKMDIVLILGMSFLPGLKVQLVKVGLTF